MRLCSLRYLIAGMSLLDSGERAAPEIKVGDIILFGKYSGTEVTVSGDEHLILRESDILAKFD